LPILPPSTTAHTCQALSKPDLAIAEKAFVRSKDFQGIEFVRRLRRLDDPGKQAAEVAVYFRVRFLYIDVCVVFACR
jgi:hypothetical protein